MANVFVGTVTTGAIIGTYNECASINSLQEELQKSKTSTENVTSCAATPMPPKNHVIKILINIYYNKQVYLITHQVKKDWMGDKAQISRFDLCGCKDGRVVIKAQGCKGKIATSTEYNWK